MKKSTKVAILISIFDLLASNLAYGIALWFRFDLNFGDIPAKYFDGWLMSIPIFTVATLITFILMGLYKSVWRYVSYDELYRVLGACLITLVVMIAETLLLFIRMPLSFYAVGFILQVLIVGGARVSYRALRTIGGQLKRSKNDKLERILIVGSGSAGLMLLRELSSPGVKESYAVGFVDDDPNRKGRKLNNVPVLGVIEDIPSIVEERDIDRIIIAIPSLEVQRRREIIDICKETNCRLSMLPGVSQLINGKVKLSDVKEVTVEELLQRDPIEINMGEMQNFFTDRTILVTGGGGSIGSELVRQLAQYNPRKIVVLDIYENNVYDLQQELLSRYRYLDLEVLIGSIRDEKRIRQIFEKYKPEIVCNAAAHKHVPLMEDSPNEAIKNNVFGTYVIAKAAGEYGTKAFVQISTDKAVNPTNIMGASKRLCEMVIEGMREKYSGTNYSMVRFGNVLGSNGSVVPLFKRQIEKGGPVTVTHPEITRFFMTIPEAVTLILQTMILSKGNGQVFVLDMGQPVKIDDLARNLIYLSGHTPDVDIKIEYTGLRPGEKLYEELLMEEEGLQKTSNNLIYIGKTSETPEGFWDKLEELKEVCSNNDPEIKDKVADIVTTYKRKSNDN